MPTEPYTPAELEAATRALDAKRACDHREPNNPAPGVLSCDRCDAAAVLDAVLPDHDARIRAQVAADIQAHADQHAPAGYPLNHPRTVLRRHLLLAARIAEGPLTDADLADIAAQVVGIARAHATTEGDHHA